MSFNEFVNPQDSENIDNENGDGMKFPVNVVPDDTPIPSGLGRHRIEIDSQEEARREIDEAERIGRERI